jgi:hypothetical protein
MSDLAACIKIQDLIEKALTKGADMPLYEPKIAEIDNTLSSAKSAYAQAPYNEFARAGLNRALAIRRDSRMRIGRYGALHLAEVLGLRANYETGDRLA